MGLWLACNSSDVPIQVLTALETKDEMAARMDSIKSLKVQVGTARWFPRADAIFGVYFC